MTDDTPLRIETAAITKDGTVYTLPRPARHADVVRHMADIGIRATLDPDAGFLLSDGRFVRRTAALRVARMSGQLLEGARPRLGELTTGDVW